jgi:hypothetical protein
MKELGRNSILSQGRSVQNIFFTTLEKAKERREVK